MPFSIVLAAGFMTLLDVSIVNVALPSIEAGLHAGPAQVQWIVAGYALTFGLTLVAAGRAGDIFGRRTLFIIGLGGFVLASAGCGFATSATMLAAMRLAQGMFAGVLNPQVLGLMQDLFTGPARARAFGVFGVIVGISTAIGPALGGALIAIAGPDLGWRLVFLINLPIGLVVLPLAAKYLPSVDHERQSLRSVFAQFDPVGVTLVGITVVLIMFPFLSSSGEGGTSGSTNAHVYWLLVVAAVVAGIVVVWEKWFHAKGREVLLDPALVHNPSFVLGVLTAFFYFSGFTSIFIIFTLYLQQGLGWTAFSAGLAAVPFALVSGFTSGISGRLLNRYGRVIPVLGSLIVVLGVLGMAGAATWVPFPYEPFAVIGFMMVAGVGSGIIISPNQALTLEDVPRGLAGIAAALLQTFQRLGTAIGLAVVTTVYFVAASGPASSVNPGHAIAVASVVVGALVFLSFVTGVIDWRRRTDDRAKLSKTVQDTLAKNPDNARNPDDTRNPDNARRSKNALNPNNPNNQGSR